MKQLFFATLVATAAIFSSFAPHKKTGINEKQNNAETYYVVYAHCACTPDKDGKFDKYLFVSEVVYGKASKLCDAFNNQVKIDYYHWGQIPLAETWNAETERKAFDKRREKIAEYKADGYIIKYVTLYSNRNRY